MISMPTTAIYILAPIQGPIKLIVTLGHSLSSLFHVSFVRDLVKHLDMYCNYTDNDFFLLKDEDEDPCVICHDDLHTGSIWELHCMHRFHKEVQYVCTHTTLVNTINTVL